MTAKEFVEKYKPNTFHSFKTRNGKWVVTYKHDNIGLSFNGTVFGKTEANAWNKMKKKIYINTKIFKKSISEIDFFTSRIKNSLYDAEIYTVRDLCIQTKRDLMMKNDIYKRTISCIEEFLESNNLCLGMNVDSIIKKYKK